MIIRLITLLLLLARSLYWLVTEFQAHQAKPKLHQISLKEISKRGVTTAVGGLIFMQLLGLSIWPFMNTNLIELTGLMVVIFSIAISIWARREIGANWTHAAEYQIKKDHQLVDQGIYRYIRHPIYSSIALSILGSELVVGSYLVIVFMVVLPVVIYIQAKNEETILIHKFGDKYNNYMKNSKMLIPFIF